MNKFILSLAAVLMVGCSSTPASNLGEKDPEKMLSVIEKVADTVHTNRPLYDMYVTQLLS